MGDGYVIKPNSTQIDVLISVLGINPAGQDAAILKLYGATDKFQSPVAEILGAYVGPEKEKLISGNDLSEKLGNISKFYVSAWLHGTLAPTNEQIDKLKSILPLSEQEESVLRSNALPEKSHQLSIKNPSKLADIVTPYMQEQHMSHKDLLEAINNIDPNLQMTLVKLQLIMHTNRQGSRAPTEEEARAIVQALHIRETDTIEASQLLSIARPKGKSGRPPSK